MRKLIKDYVIEKVTSKNSNKSTDSMIKSSPEKLP